LALSLMIHNRIKKVVITKALDEEKQT